MTFAKRVFTGAGIWGLIVLPPLYFLKDTIGSASPPAITHPEFYFGFVAVAMAWQLAFFVIGSDPVRFRPLMLPAVFEKVGWVATLFVLYAQGHVAPSQLIFAGTDLTLGILFIVAFFKTPFAR